MYWSGRSSLLFRHQALSFGRDATLNRSGQSTSLRSSLAILFQTYADWQAVGERLETDSVLLFSNNGPYWHPFFTFGIRTNPLLRAEHFFREAAHWFASKNKHQFVIVTIDGQDEDLRHLLSRAGVEQIGGSERMQLLNHPSSPSHQGSALTHSNLEDFLSICAAAFGYKRECLDALFRERSRFMKSLVAGRVFYKDAAPIGTGIAIQTGPAVTLDWIGTHPFHRGEGLALNCVQSLCCDVLSHRAGPIVLSSTLAGKTVYEKAGFSAFGDVRLHRIPITIGT